jgi:hypothetical protein
MKFRFVFWDVLPCKIIVDPRQYIPEDKSELHTRCRENLKSHIGEKWLLNIAYEVSLSYSLGSIMCRKFYGMGPMALLPLRWKSCC